MRADEIRELSADDITARIASLEEERFRLRFRSGTEQLETPIRLRTIRRDIARLHTVLREKQRAAGSGQPATAGQRVTGGGKGAAKTRGRTARKSAGRQ
jgi:large subunit ribosomal protein L29